jgi:hypothetical protein
MSPTSSGITAAAVLLVLVETAFVAWLLLHRAAGRRAQGLLEDRLRFETLLADLSAKLIHVEAGGLDAALESALRQMIAFLGMDRGNLDEYVEGVPGMRLSCAGPGFMKLPSILAVEQFPIARATSASGRAPTCRSRCGQADRCSVCCRSIRSGASAAGPTTSSNASTS